MEMTQKELTRAIAEGLSSVVKERCDQIDSRVNALAESLSRRLDALERQAVNRVDDVFDLRHLVKMLRLDVSAMRADTDRLCREADAKKFENQAGAVGRPATFRGEWQPPGPGYHGAISYGTPTIEEYMKAFGNPPSGSGGSNSDSKDALIRDLMVYPRKQSYATLCDRAERLGVRL